MINNNCGKCFYWIDSRCKYWSMMDCLESMACVGWEDEEEQVGDVYDLGEIELEVVL